MVDSHLGSGDPCSCVRTQKPGAAGAQPTEGQRETRASLSSGLPKGWALVLPGHPFSWAQI